MEDMIQPGVQIVKLSPGGWVVVVDGIVVSSTYNTQKAAEYEAMWSKIEKVVEAGVVWGIRETVSNSINAMDDTGVIIESKLKRLSEIIHSYLDRYTPSLILSCLENYLKEHGHAIKTD